jgi:hypothetical protein
VTWTVLDHLAKDYGKRRQTARRSLTLSVGGQRVHRHNRLSVGRIWEGAGAILARAG